MKKVAGEAGFHCGDGGLSEDMERLLWGGASIPTFAAGANPLAESPPNAGVASTMTPGQSN